MTAAIGVFTHPQHARQAVRALQQSGFRPDQIGVIAPGPEGRRTTAHEAKVAQVAGGAATGVAAGAGAGALWALGIAAGVLPGIGPAVTGGLLASVLSSAAGGATVGGLAGALIGLGIPEEDPRSSVDELRSGRTLVTVQAEGRALEAWSILQHHAGSRRR
jgi:hypothetical protein